MNVARESACPRATRIVPFLTFALALIATGAVAQDKEAMEAIKSNCRSDYMANCMSVSPGGKEALECLRKNLAKLSPACSNAVNATMTKSSPSSAAAPPPPAERAPAAAKASGPPPKQAAAPSSPGAGQMEAIKANCRSDYMTKCNTWRRCHPAARARCSALCNRTPTAAIPQIEGKRARHKAACAELTVRRINAVMGFFLATVE